MGSHGFKRWSLGSSIAQLHVDLFFDQVKFHGVEGLSIPAISRGLVLLDEDGVAKEQTSRGLTPSQCEQLASALRSPDSAVLPMKDSGELYLASMRPGKIRKLVAVGGEGHVEVDLHDCDCFLLASLLEEACRFDSRVLELRERERDARWKASP